jgi:hypothetical protein
MTKVRQHHDEDLNVFEVGVVAPFFYLPEKRYKSTIINYKNKKSMGQNFSYKQQFGVIAIAENEEEQKRIFEQLKALGLKLKIVVV